MNVLAQSQVCISPCLLVIMLLFYTILVSSNALFFLSSTSFTRSNYFLFLVFLDVICRLFTTIFNPRTSNRSLKVNYSVLKFLVAKPNHCYVEILWLELGTGGTKGLDVYWSLDPF